MINYYSIIYSRLPRVFSETKMERNQVGIFNNAQAAQPPQPEEEEGGGDSLVRIRSIPIHVDEH